MGISGFRRRKRMNKTFEDLILDSQFNEAKGLLSNLTEEQIGQEILYLACKTKKMTTYGFIIYELLYTESSFWHYMAGKILLAPLFFIEGAYPLGVFHARRAIKLAPENIEYKKLLLAFYNLPEPAISKEEALQLAKEIIAVDQTADNAAWVIEELEK